MLVGFVSRCSFGELLRVSHVHALTVVCNPYYLILPTTVINLLILFSFSIINTLVLPGTGNN